MNMRLPGHSVRRTQVGLRWESRSRAASTGIERSVGMIESARGGRAVRRKIPALTSNPERVSDCLYTPRSDELDSPFWLDKPNYRDQGDPTDLCTLRPRP